MPELPKILLLASDQPEVQSVAEILSESATLHYIRTLAELRDALEKKEYSALLFPWSSPGGSWQDVLAMARERRPELPVIVVAREGGWTEWAQVLEAGAFDLLVPPFRASVVSQVVEQAIVSSEARRITLRNRGAHKITTERPAPPLKSETDTP